MERIKFGMQKNNGADLRSTQSEFCSWWGCSQLHKAERCEYCPVLFDIYRMAEQYGIRFHRYCHLSQHTDNKKNIFLIG